MQEAPFEIAIVGGGIVGVTLAAGLVRRNIKVKLFEQARNFTESGAGIGFTASTVRCMQQINPDIVTSLREGGAVPNGAFRYLDGYSRLDPNDPDYEKPLFHLDAGEKGWETVRRDLFLLELVKKLPVEIFRLESRLSHVEQEGPDGKVILTFTDGSSYSADALIACDGIKSKTRQILLGPDDPASYPQYTHKVSYRTLLPIDKVRQAIGDYKTKHLHFHIGPGAHFLHYPVNDKLVGSAIFVHDHEDWPLDSPTTASGSRDEVLKSFEGWSEPVRKFLELVPEKLEKWALFDMYEHPLKQYNFDRIALAGDAAHASSPHHGAGASFGIEDVLCLSALMEDANDAVVSKAVHKNTALKTAFETYDAIRRTRTQWLVNSSRRTCDFYQQEEWGDAVRRVKAETCFEEVKDRSHKVWHFDPAKMVSDTIETYARRLLDVAPEASKQRPTLDRHDTLTNGLKKVEEAIEAIPASPKLDWLVQIPDHAGMLQTRIANIQSHMSNTSKRLKEDVLVMAGPSFNASEVRTQRQQPSMTGSIQVVKASSEEEVYRMLSEDPFAKLGVWDLSRATLQPMRVGVDRSASQP